MKNEIVGDVGFRVQVARYRVAPTRCFIHFVRTLLVHLLNAHHSSCRAERFPGVPLAAYNVSGEYSMIKAAAGQGWLDQRDAAQEMLLAIRRAGAGIVLTYWAKDVAGWLAE